jgi:hypothetical protein
MFLRNRKKKQRIKKLMTASQVFLELTNGASVRPATVRRCVVSKSSTRRKEKEDLGERQVLVEIAV